MGYDVNGKIVSNDYPITDIKITSETKYTMSTSGIQSAFVTESGTVWMITQSGSCLVVENGTTTKTITLDHTVGHANTANYADGKAYISDWTDGTKIHVFTVDDTNKTMTYSKDITIPQTYGRTDFFVFDNENQVVSLGWNVTHADDSSCMILGLWKKDNTGTYIKAYEYPVVGVTLAQGMCVHNDKLYLVDNTSNYKHIGIVIVDLETGIQTEDKSQTGAILNLETEGIVPLSENTFLVVAYNGSQFLLTESINP